jgi:hypothetical protein
MNYLSIFWQLELNKCEPSMLLCFIIDGHVNLKNKAPLSAL